MNYKFYMRRLVFYSSKCEVLSNFFSHAGLINKVGSALTDGEFLVETQNINLPETDIECI